MSADEFQDFSTVTPFERLVAALEWHLQCWSTKGLDEIFQEATTAGKTINCGPNTYVVLREFIRHKKGSRSTETYVFALYVPWHTTGKPIPSAARTRSTARASPHRVQHITVRRSGRHRPNAHSSSGAKPHTLTPSTGRAGGQSPFGPASQSPGGSPKGDGHGALTRSDDWFEDPVGCSCARELSPGYSGSTVFRPHIWDWQHALEVWFGVDIFLTLAPTGGVLSDSVTEEAGMLTSALGAALSSCRLFWPAFVPFDESTYAPYWGVAWAGNATVHFRTDRIDSLRTPVCLTKVEGQLKVLEGQLAAYDAGAARACKVVLADMGIASLALAAGGFPQASGSFPISVSLRRRWILPPPSGRDDEEDSDSSEEWDSHCCWKPWAHQVDPIQGVHLEVVWRDLPASAALEDAFRPDNVQTVLLHAIQRKDAQATLKLPGWKCRPQDMYLGAGLPPIGTYYSDQERPGGAARDASFSAMLSAFLGGRQLALRTTHGLVELDSERFWEQVGVWPLPGRVPDALLLDLQDAVLPGTAMFHSLESHSRDVLLEEHLTPLVERLSQLVGTAPPNSLAARLALDSLLAGNARAVAGLWRAFVRILRSKYWEPTDSTGLPKLLPRMSVVQQGPSGGFTWTPLDLRSSLLHQKLHMLQICIMMRRREVSPGSPANMRFGGPLLHASLSRHPTSHQLSPGWLKGSRKEGDLHMAQEADVSMAGSDTDSFESAGEGPLDEELSSSPKTPPLLLSPTPPPAAGILDGVEMEGGGPLIVPNLQQLPFFTLDQVQEENPWFTPMGWEEAEVLVRERRSSRVVRSDMQAFKAANPSAVLSDFIRWHCRAYAPVPAAQVEAADWSKLWEMGAPLAAAQQAPLMNPLKMGEHALHFLESLSQRAEAIWDHLLPTAFSVPAAVLAQSPAANLPAVAATVDRFAKAAEQAFRNAKQDPADASALLETFHRMEAAIVGVESLSRSLPPCPSLVNRVMAVALEPPRPNGRGPGLSRDDSGGSKAVPMESQSSRGEGPHGGPAGVPPRQNLGSSHSTGSPPASHRSHMSVLRNRSRRRSQETEGSGTGDGPFSHHQEGILGSLPAASMERDLPGVSPRFRRRLSSMSDAATGPAFPEEMDESAALHSGLVCTPAELDALSRQMREGAREASDLLLGARYAGLDHTEDGEEDRQDVAPEVSEDLPGFPGWGPPILSEWLLRCEHGGVAEEGGGANLSSSSTGSTSRLPPHRLYVSTSQHGAPRIATTIVAES
eukprot:jgi/Botrbrau1/5002/Bobra.0396s0025.2